MELVEFLLARIAEDEEAARKAVEWSTEWLTADDGVLERVGFVGDGPDVHIARWSPARVLAECGAKRRLIALGEKDSYWDDVLRLLALPYADHPDYREEWRP